jgi:polysaccharide biosynthesis protein PslH
LPYLTAVKHAQRVWYAADEWVVHHLSQFFFTRPESWTKLWAALIMGAYEWAFASTTDRVWLVSQRDARAARLVMPGIHADLVPNGVDSDHFAPQDAPELDQSCVFWGRLDFGPNVDALRWFAKNVWTPLSKRHKGATFTVFGFNPGEEVRRLASDCGFELIADQPDIRALICQRQLVVLPFISGAGIKNKLLEAASLARPVLASRRALNGVDLSGEQPVVVVSRPRDWITQISRLWEDALERARLGAAARAWVQRKYTWPAAAERVVAGLAVGVSRRG